MVHGISSGAALALRTVSAGLPITRLSVYESPFETGSELQEGADYEARMRALLAKDRRGAALTEFLGAVGMPPEALLRLRQLPVWADMKALATLSRTTTR
ncbi:hypothetical protein [Streptomyces sp. ISL-10]|uniref:hypothetical protein n=1 Tax=Streptomyces sp. ISL-10 TaxID=2819172 RepID=UPI0027E3C5A4|nr:hypothetical protein [Streptomyces sp. ISL-10]